MSSPESRETKVVQTELDRDVYEQLRRVADQEDSSLKRVVELAIIDYVRRNFKPEPSDPLFAVTPGTGDRDTDARNTDEYLGDAIDEGDRA